MDDSGTYTLTCGFSLPVTDTNLSFINFGFQDRDENHSQGPLAKTEHILQYISEGKGYLTVKGKTYSLKSGDLFYLPKNVLLSYKSEKSDPYRYFWIGYDGTSAAALTDKIGLTPDSPVLHLCDARITSVYENIGGALKEGSFSSFMDAVSGMYKLFSLLLSFNAENIQKMQNVSVEYVNKAVIYIQNNFAADINVTSIAEAIGLGRNYFSVIFRKHTGFTPVGYLMKYRIDQAQKMLKQGMTVTEAAMSCGFNSPANFSVQFKKITGVSPKKYQNA